MESRSGQREGAGNWLPRGMRKLSGPWKCSKSCMCCWHICSQYWKKHTILFLHQERESPFPRFCYRQRETVRNFLPYTFGGRGGTQTFSLLQVLRKAVLADGEEPEQETRLLDLEPAQPITSHMTLVKWLIFLRLTFLICKMGIIIPTNIELLQVLSNWQV